MATCPVVHPESLAIRAGSRFWETSRRHHDRLLHHTSRGLARPRVRLGPLLSRWEFMPDWYALTSPPPRAPNTAR